ncbi:MAG TPA: phosphopantetheine-binding protein [Gammaproteobacteria bacterium]|nr:phosphopantetheine-binding protein [Gammaproteobacteria bacterium]
MNQESLRKLVLDTLGHIAPDADPAALDPAVNIRDQIDFDSMDFYNFAVALHEKLGVEIPESDYPRLSSIDGCVRYLQDKADSRAAG